MKYSVFIACLLAFFSMSMLVKAGSLEDEIAAARKKICGGLALAAPKKGQTFTNPKKVSITVTRVPNKDSKTVNGVMIYSVDKKGQLKYLSDVKSKPYKLNKKATLNVDISKIRGIKFPGQFEFRVWVRNGTHGPDCNLYSPVFNVRSASSHSNAAEEELEFEQLNKNNLEGCFGTKVLTSVKGTEHRVNSPLTVTIVKDTASHVKYIQDVSLMSISLDHKSPELVKSIWTGGQKDIHHVFNLKNTVADTTPEKTAFFYKVKALTTENKSCNFYSKAFFSKE
ncbi:unnamed protein product [Cunninghamella echinulata]